MSTMRWLTARSPDASNATSPWRWSTFWEAPALRSTRVTSQVLPSTSNTRRTRAMPAPEVISFLVSLPICGVLP